MLTLKEFKSDSYFSYIFHGATRNGILLALKKMGAKIRDAEINKIPIMIILGEKELNEDTSFKLTIKTMIEKTKWLDTFKKRKTY